MPDELTQLTDDEIVLMLFRQTIDLLQAYRTRAHLPSPEPGYWTVHAVSEEVAQATFDLLKALQDMGLARKAGENAWI